MLDSDILTDPKLIDARLSRSFGFLRYHRAQVAGTSEQVGAGRQAGKPDAAPLDIFRSFSIRGQATPPYETFIISRSAPRMDPSQQTSIASNAGVRRRLDRSCMVCHRRKVRCDKKIPCANCVRAGVLCHFPSTDRPEPRKSRTTISDIASRLGQLERTITAIASSDYSLKNEDSVQDRSQSPHAPSPSQDGASDSPATGENSSSSGLLVQDGYSSQYVNEVLLSRVLEEVLLGPIPIHPEEEMCLCGNY